MPSALLEPADNPYRSTANWEGTSPRGGYRESDLIELRAFVGARADHYLRKWLPRLEDPDNGDVGMSWVALFFPTFWMGYRKLYRPALIYLALTVAASIGLQVLFVNSLQMVQVPLGATFIVRLMMNLVCALYGNAWYLQHAENVIARARQAGKVGDQMLITLMRRGGTSWLGLVGMFVLGAIANIIAAIFVLMSQFAGGLPGM